MGVSMGGKMKSKRESLLWLGASGFCKRCTFIEKLKSKVYKQTNKIQIHLIEKPPVCANLWLSCRPWQSSWCNYLIVNCFPVPGLHTPGVSVISPQHLPPSVSHLKIIYQSKSNFMLVPNNRMGSGSNKDLQTGSIFKLSTNTPCSIKQCQVRSKCIKCQLHNWQGFK